METTKIKALLSAVKNKSLSRAAEEFSYTPSALSHMADSLEEELGVKLLERTPAGVTLTEEGELLYAKLLAVVNAERELCALAAQISSSREDELKIGTYSSISMNILPEILRRFKKEHPKIRVSISVADSLKGWLDCGNADVIFADVGAFGDNESVSIMEDRFVAVVPDEAFKKRKTVVRDELYSYSYISTNETSLRKYFDEERFKELIHFDSVDDMSVISMVKEGIGIAVLPALVMKRPHKGVRAIKLEPKISRVLGFAYKKEAAHSGATEKFISFLGRLEKLQ